MPVATLTKAGSYSVASIPNRQFKFQVAEQVTEEQVEMLRPCGYFKFTADGGSEEGVGQEGVSAAEPIATPKGGIKITRKSTAPKVDEGVGV